MILVLAAACSGDDDAGAAQEPEVPPVTEEGGGEVEVAAVDLSARADSVRVLENPDKGLYHHFYDDAGIRYGERNPGDLAALPGLDHLYLRMPWSQLEPADDEYDWALIDDIVAEYAPQGLRFAFAITCKETEIEYAAPEWLRDLGATGTEIVGIPWDAEQRVWEPNYGDPIFLEKLGEFHEAMAERYAGEPWLAYVQIASYGSWGEGHNWPATDSIYPFDVQMANVDAFVDAYPDDVLLTITDDWYGNVSDPTFRSDFRAYVESRGITYSDHSPLVDYYIGAYPATASIRSPELFDAVYESLPIPIELEHYVNVKNEGNWGGENGADGGAELVRGILENTHATYISFHGYVDEYVAENPEFVRELANRVGYWLFVDDAAVSVGEGGALAGSVTVRNAGSAPVYNDYALELRLDGGGETYDLAADASGLAGLDAGEVLDLPLAAALPADLPAGEYALRARLVDADRSGRPVDVALGADFVDADGFWEVAAVTLP